MLLSQENKICFKFLNMKKEMEGITYEEELALKHEYIDNKLCQKLSSDFAYEIIGDINDLGDIYSSQLR